MSHVRGESVSSRHCDCVVSSSVVCLRSYEYTIGRVCAWCADAVRCVCPAEINSQFVVYETHLRDLSDEVMTLNQRMEEYLNSITTRAEFYRTCQS